MSMIDFAIKEVGDDRYSSGIQSYPLLSSVLLVPPPPLYPSPSIYFLYPVIMGKVAAVGHIITLTVLAWGIALIVIILL